MKQVYQMPGNTLRIILDSSEIYPNDPGAGCPALVECGNYTASLECAYNEGELEYRGDYKELSARQSQWIASVYDSCQKWLDTNTPPAQI